jgi:hypothetical protein
MHIVRSSVDCVYILRFVMSQVGAFGSALVFSIPTFFSIDYQTFISGVVGKPCKECGILRVG